MKDLKVICGKCGRVFQIWNTSAKTVECPHCDYKADNPHYQPASKPGPHVRAR